MAALLVFVAVAVTALVGYRVSAHGDVAAAKPPACLAGREPARADFPAGLPIARDLVVRTRYRSRGARVTESYAPGTLAGLRSFYYRALERRGFDLVNGDAERFEVETDFARGSVRGHLRLNQFAACPGVIYLAVVDRTPA
jgi:hypothetical protein